MDSDPGFDIDVKNEKETYQTRVEHKFKQDPSKKKAGFESLPIKGHPLFKNTERGCEEQSTTRQLVMHVKTEQILGSQSQYNFFSDNRTKTVWP